MKLLQNTDLRLLTWRLEKMTTFTYWLLVSAPPELSGTNIMRWLKGISAWQLFRKCPELQTSHRKKQDRHLWSPSYYVESIGTVNEQAVAKYIDDQRRKEVNLE